MSYLFNNQSDQQDWSSRYEGAQLPEDFSPDFYEPNTYLDRTLSNALTPARIATRSIANLGIAADAVPTAIGKYYGVDNDWWHKHVTESLIHTRDALTPDPQTTHVALQVADQFAGMASDFALTGGNPGLFSAMQGAKRVTEEIDKGKSLGTSLDLGTVDAVENLAFTKLPVGFASKALPLPKWLQGSISGAGIGVGLGSVGELANQAILNRDGYSEEANQHDWSNSMSLVLSAAFGAAFGSLHPHVLPSHQDAILTANDAQAIQSPDGLEPTNPKSANDMANGMNKAVTDLVNGDPITSFIPVSEKPTIPDDLIALAGNKMSRGDRKPLEQEKKDIEYKLKQIEEGDYTQQSLDLANEQQAKIDAENAGKRIPARKLADQRKANLETANDLAESLRQKDAQPHKDALDRINEILAKDDEARAAHSEISRIEQQHLLDNGFIKHPDAQKMQDALQNEVKKSVELSEGEQFAQRTGRSYEEDPVYADGSAHLFNRVLDFYEKHVAHLAPKSKDDMPNALFRLGEVSDLVAAGLYEFLPGFNDSLREVRISAKSIKHIHGSRPSIARDVLRNLEAVVSRADEVLPNPKNPNRALLVLKNIENSGKKNKHSVNVLDISANGKGIDVVSSMTSLDNYLKEARLMAEESRNKDLVGGAAVPSSSLSADLHQQHHPATDFPKLNQVLDESISQITTNASKNESPDITRAREAIPSISNDRVFEIEHDDGTTDTGTASELMGRADQESAFADKSELATDSAITCFLKFGDL